METRWAVRARGHLGGCLFSKLSFLPGVGHPATLGGQTIQERGICPQVVGSLGGVGGLGHTEPTCSWRSECREEGGPEEKASELQPQRGSAAVRGWVRVVTVEKKIGDAHTYSANWCVSAGPVRTGSSEGSRVRLTSWECCLGGLESPACWWEQRPRSPTKGAHPEFLGLHRWHLPGKGHAVRVQSR